MANRLVDDRNELVSDSRSSVSVSVKDRAGKRRFFIQVDRDISDFEIADLLAKHIDFQKVEDFISASIGQCIEDYISKAKQFLVRKGGSSVRTRAEDGASGDRLEGDI